MEKYSRDYIKPSFLNIWKAAGGGYDEEVRLSICIGALV